MADKAPRKHKWIKTAIIPAHKGALHRELHVPEGQKIPEAKLEAAKHSDNPTERKRADLAETLKGMHHGKASRLYGKTKVARG